MENEPQVVKEASCPSLSYQSTVTYEIVTDQQGTIYLSVVKNSGNGIFNSERVSLPAVLDLLNDHDGPFTWEALRPLFPDRSANTACFLMAALLAEGLVQPSMAQPRRYEVADPKEFAAKVQALMAHKPKKKGAKPPPDDPVTDAVADPPAGPTEAAS